MTDESDCEGEAQRFVHDRWRRGRCYECGRTKIEQPLPPDCLIGILVAAYSDGVKSHAADESDCKICETVFHNSGTAAGEYMLYVNTYCSLSNFDCGKQCVHCFSVVKEVSRHSVFEQSEFQPVGSINCFHMMRAIAGHLFERFVNDRVFLAGPHVGHFLTALTPAQTFCFVKDFMFSPNNIHTVSDGIVYSDVVRAAFGDFVQRLNQASMRVALLSTRTTKKP
jgi:hypothetical protein